VPPLSATDTIQRGALELVLCDTHLTDSPNSRSLPLCAKSGGALRTSDLYKLCIFGGVRDTNFEFVRIRRPPEFASSNGSSFAGAFSAMPTSTGKGPST
jgi:hypothetical protein